MISPEEFVDRTMVQIYIRRTRVLHNGERRHIVDVIDECPCTTTPHSSTELRLLESIESSLAHLLKIFETGAEGIRKPVEGEEPDGRWTDTTSMR